MRQLTDVDPADPSAAIRRQVLVDIAANGVHIASADPDGDRPCWSYTVGLLHTYGQPEVLAIGLPREVAVDLLDSLVDEVDGGLQLAAGAQIEGLVRHYPVRLLAVPADLAAKWLPLVDWAYEGAATPCLQLVYPDKQGRWPWQPDVRQGFAAAQPVLERLGGDGAPSGSIAP